MREILLPALIINNSKKMQENHNSSINDEEASSGFSEPMEGHESSSGNADEFDEMSIQMQEQQAVREQIGEAMESRQPPRGDLMKTGMSFGDINGGGAQAAG